MTKRLIIITGPTGVGKTPVAVRVAQALDTEILSCDSRQFYQEMSVGTAIPEKEFLEAIPHHFIQHISIHEYYNASLYEVQALEILSRLFKTHNEVVLTGGTGLYMDAVRFGIDDFPTIDLSIRNDLKNRLEVEGLASLVEELQRLDPETHSLIDLKNPKRVQKALEVCLMTGMPYSGFLTHPKKPRDFEVSLFVLNRPREELYHSINDRVVEMVKRGLFEEARELYPYRNLNALNTVGYKEVFRFLEGKITREESIRQIQANTRKYARKQITWFRKDPNSQWLQPKEWQKIII